MMKRFTCLLLLIVSSLVAYAQEVTRVTPVPDRPVRKFVIADMETRVPIRKAVVTTKDGYRDSSNYRGVVRIPRDFDTLRVYKAGYLPTKLSLKEAGDTTFLIPSGKSLREVTVWGKDGSNRANENMAGGLLQAIREGAAEAPKGIASFDFANMLDRRGRRDRKHLKKVKAAFDKMDQLDDDPIVNAYLKDQENKRLKKEHELAQAARDSLLNRKKEADFHRLASEGNSQQLADSLAGRIDTLLQEPDTISAHQIVAQPETTSSLSSKNQTSQSVQVDMKHDNTNETLTDDRTLPQSQATRPKKLTEKKTGK